MTQYAKHHVHTSDRNGDTALESAEAHNSQSGTVGGDADRDLPGLHGAAGKPQSPPTPHAPPSGEGYGLPPRGATTSLKARDENTGHMPAGTRRPGDGEDVK